MKLWALILAAGAILAFAAPVAADAAASPAGTAAAPAPSTPSRATARRRPSRSAISCPASSRSSGSSTGPTRLRRALAGSGQLDAVLAPNPSAWQLWLTSRWAWAWLV